MERQEYLESLSDEYNVPQPIVDALAESLGPSEDYDGLVSILEDYEYFAGEYNGGDID